MFFGTFIKNIKKMFLTSMLPSDTGERAPPQRQPDNLPTPEGWKAELT